MQRPMPTPGEVWPPYGKTMWRELVLRAPIGRALWSLSWPLAAANELMMLHLSILIFWLDRFAVKPGRA